MTSLTNITYLTTINPSNSTFFPNSRVNLTNLTTSNIPQGDNITELVTTVHDAINQHINSGHRFERAFGGFRWSLVFIVFMIIVIEIILLVIGVWLCRRKKHESDETTDKIHQCHFGSPPDWLKTLSPSDDKLAPCNHLHNINDEWLDEAQDQSAADEQKSISAASSYSRPWDTSSIRS